MYIVSCICFKTNICKKLENQNLIFSCSYLMDKKIKFSGEKIINVWSSG